MVNVIWKLPLLQTCPIIKGETSEIRIEAAKLNKAANDLR